jgi:hypothetical protein
MRGIFMEQVMQTIYEGSLGSELFQRIASQTADIDLSKRDAATRARLDEIASGMKTDRKRVRRIARIAKQVRVFSLHLVGNGADVPIATVVTAKGLESACKTALRAFSGTFKSLELPGYAIKEQGGGDRMPLEELMNRN